MKDETVELWVQIISFLMPYLIGAAIAGGAVWEIQGARITSRDADIKVLKVQNDNLAKANAESQKAIVALQDDVKNANKLCSTQLGVEKKKTDRIAYIDGLRGGPKTQGESTEVIENTQKKGGPGNEKNGSVDTGGDPIAVELSGMFHGSDSGSVYAVHQEGNTADAAGAESLSCTVEGGGHPVRLYCLDEENAKALLKNQSIDTAYQAQCLTILENLQTGEQDEQNKSTEQKAP